MESTGHWRAKLELTVDSATLNDIHRLEEGRTKLDKMGNTIRRAILASETILDKIKALSLSPETSKRLKFTQPDIREYYIPAHLRRTRLGRGSEKPKRHWRVYSESNNGEYFNSHHPKGGHFKGADHNCRCLNNLIGQQSEREGIDDRIRRLRFENRGLRASSNRRGNFIDEFLEHYHKEKAASGLYKDPDLKTDIKKVEEPPTTPDCLVHEDECGCRKDSKKDCNEAHQVCYSQKSKVVDHQQGMKEQSKATRHQDHLQDKDEQLKRPIYEKHDLGEQDFIREELISTIKKSGNKEDLALLSIVQDQTKIIAHLAEQLRLESGKKQESTAKKDDPLSVEKINMHLSEEQKEGHSAVNRTINEKFDADSPAFGKMKPAGSEVSFDHSKVAAKYHHNMKNPIHFQDCISNIPHKENSLGSFKEIELKMKEFQFDQKDKLHAGTKPQEIKDNKIHNKIVGSDKKSLQVRGPEVDLKPYSSREHGIKKRHDSSEPIERLTENQKINLLLSMALEMKKKSLKKETKSESKDKQRTTKKKALITKKPQKKARSEEKKNRSKSPSKRIDVPKRDQKCMLKTRNDKNHLAKEGTFIAFLAKCKREGKSCLKHPKQTAIRDPSSKSRKKKAPEAGLRNTRTLNEGAICSPNRHLFINSILRKKISHEAIDKEPPLYTKIDQYLAVKREGRASLS